VQSGEARSCDLSVTQQSEQSIPQPRAEYRKRTKATRVTSSDDTTARRADETVRTGRNTIGRRYRWGSDDFILDALSQTRQLVQPVHGDCHESAICQAAVKHPGTSQNVSHSPLNISKTVRDRGLVPNDHQ